MKPDNIAELRGRFIGGWISPEGLFFQAQYEEHVEVAHDIIEQFLHAEGVYYISDWLEERGWIRLETDGCINHPYEATGQQVDVLYSLYSRACPSWYKDELYGHIAPAVLGIAREPMPRVPSQGDQENYRRTKQYA